MSLRYERKFFVRGLDKGQLEVLIKKNPAYFREIYQQRTVQSIYFDSPTLGSALDNLFGNPTRVKYRLRWYGKSNRSISKAQLEIKRKKGSVGSKHQYLLKKFQIKDNLSAEDFNLLWKQSNLPPALTLKLQDLRPVLWVCYKRRYFLSQNRKLRLTFDTHIQYRQLRPFDFSSWTRENENTYILELKYPPMYEEQAATAANAWPFRLSRSSKYVLGLQKSEGSPYALA